MSRVVLLKKVSIVFVILAIASVCIFAAAWHNTDIPKLYFQGDISGMESKTDARSIAFRYKDGSKTISGFAEIKLQGTSSLEFDKKNYTLKFYKDAEHENSLALDMGWGLQSKYCMKANWIDRTHSRNIVTARLASQMQAKYGLLDEAPNHGLIDGFPVEIYSNGEFLGLYTFNIPKDTWQFGMDCDNPDHIVIGGEGWEPANLFRGTPDFDSWAVEVGEESAETLAKMTRLFEFVANSTDEEFKKEFSEYLNLDSALNYYVMADLAYLGDNLGKNMMIATYDGMEWYLSLYDLDSSWGTSYTGLSLNAYDETLLNLSYSNLFARMEKAFPEQLANRYFELRQDVLSNAHILEEFEAFQNEVPALTFLKDAARWGIGKIRLPSELPGYDCSQIEDYLDVVSDRLDDKYAAMLGE